MTASPFVVDAATVPARAPGEGASTERALLGAHTGSPWLEQSLLECRAGSPVRRSTGDAEEVLFALGGHGSLRVAGGVHQLEPEAGACLAPGQRYELEAAPGEELRIVAVRIPGPVDTRAGGADEEVVRRLSEQDAQGATSNREFRVIADPSTGLRSATHFVGYIPVARAPDHFHTYDEVIYVIDGEGAFFSGGRSTPLRPGSCIALPARTIHCLENTGRDVMRVVAVFRPAGSPAAAYYPDGRPAYEGIPPASGPGFAGTEEQSATTRR